MTTKFARHPAQENDAPVSPSSRINVGGPERWGSVASGALLTYFGLKKNGWLGKLLLSGAGGLLLYRGLTGHGPIYEQIGRSTVRTHAAQAAEVDETLTVYKPREQVYAFWREVENLPRFMRHLKSVEDLGEGRSRWTARAPKGLGTLTWEAETTADEPGKKIAWRSLPGADIQNAGTVQFEDAPEGHDGPEGRGTEVRVQISYRPPAGDVGALAARLFNPAGEQLVKEDVRRFKSLMETGEVPQIEGQPTGEGRA